MPGDIQGKFAIYSVVLKRHFAGNGIFATIF